MRYFTESASRVMPGSTCVRSSSSEATGSPPTDIGNRSFVIRSLYMKRL